MADKCTTCGKELTAFNSSIGTQQCAACARGRSPEAKAAALVSLFTARPDLTEETIAGHGFALSLPRVVVGALVLNLCAFAGQVVMRKEAHIGIMIGATIGAVLGGLIVSHKGHPLDVARWKRFWQGDVAGFLLGTVAGLAIAPGTDRASMNLGYWIAAGGGLLLGLAWAAIRDGVDREATLTAFRKWKRGDSLVA